MRRSGIHGHGVFALRRIRRGSHVLDYEGERLSEAAFEARYGDEPGDDGHTLIFRLGDGYVDASVNGNDARFINHCCDPNCEADVLGDRIVITAIKDIPPGAELTYDYSLDIEEDPTPARLRLYECRCGAARCRGTMLDPEGLAPR